MRSYSINQKAPWIKIFQHRNANFARIDSCSFAMTSICLTTKLCVFVSSSNYFQSVTEVSTFPFVIFSSYFNIWTSYCPMTLEIAKMSNHSRRTCLTSEKCIFEVSGKLAFSIEHFSTSFKGFFLLKFWNRFRDCKSYEIQRRRVKLVLFKIYIL